jgi:hypothetical protein
LDPGIIPHFVPRFISPILIDVKENCPGCGFRQRS